MYCVKKSNCNLVTCKIRKKDIIKKKKPNKLTSNFDIF